MQLAFCIVITVIVLRFLIPMLPTSHPSEDRWSRRSVPTCAGVIFLSTVFDHLFGGQWLLGVVLLLVLMVGVLDDLMPIKPWKKLVFQLFCASLMVTYGVRLELTATGLFDVPITVLWLVGVTNAFNLLDNMDGLCLGVAAVAAGFLFNSVPTIFLGTLLGLFAMNFPPATLFLGNCGAYFIGLELACASAPLGWAALLLLIVPVADTTFVTARRLMVGKSPAVGGRDHLSHELARLFGSEGLAVGVLWVCGIAGGLVSPAFL